MSDKLRDGYATALLSQFNIRLLSAIQNMRKGNLPLEVLVEQHARNACLQEIKCLVNQAHFLGHSYMCLVWLRETFMTSSGIKGAEKQHEFVNTKLLPEIRARFDFSRVKYVKGPRSNMDEGEKLRLIRNGLGHARVDIRDKYFVIGDINEKRGEKAMTYVELEWPALGELCDAFLFAVGNCLFPKSKT